jgi:hypothetical protein
MSKKLTRGFNDGEKEARDYWSECGQIFFHHREGYGITPELRNIYLGKEEDILKATCTEELIGTPVPLQRQVLSGIIDYRKEQCIGTTGARAADMERAGDNGASRCKSKTTRSSSSRKRFPLRPPRTKNKSLSRR